MLRVFLIIIFSWRNFRETVNVFSCNFEKMLTKNTNFWLNTMLMNAYFPKNGSRLHTYMRLWKKYVSLIISYVLEHRSAKLWELSILKRFVKYTSMLFRILYFWIFVGKIHSIVCFIVGYCCQNFAMHALSENITIREELMRNTFDVGRVTVQGWVSHQTQLCDSQVYRRISEVR